MENPERRNPQPDHLDIEFMPIPDRYAFKHRGWRWETLLKPVKAAPGSSARIRVHADKDRQRAENNAKAEVRRIKARLEEVAPMEKWEFAVRQIDGTEGIVGTFATFLGMYSKSEKQDQILKRKEISERMKRAAVKKKLLAEIPDNIALIRPAPGSR
jgi:hypothetical protein